MKRLTASISAITMTSLRAPCGESRSLVVGEGKLAGVCCIGPFVDAKNCIDDSGILAIQLDFMDKGGRAWRYSNVLPAMSLWPGSTDVVSIVEGIRPQGWHVGFMSHMPDGSGLRLNLPGGELIEAPRGSNTFDVVLYAKADGLVLARAQIGMLHPRAQRGGLGFEYAVNVSALLWRRAPRISRGKVEFEASDFIDLRPLDAPLPLLSRSNIEILDDKFAHNASGSSGLLALDQSSPMRTPLTLPTASPRTHRCTLVKSVAAPIRERRVIDYGGASSVEIGPGQVCGLLRLDRFTPPSDEQPDGLVSIAFDFLDESARPWRYVGLLYAWLFWPPTDAVATVTPRLGPGDLMMPTLLDGRDDASFRIHTGESITVRLKYFSFDVAMSPGPDPAAIRVHAIMCPVNDHPLAPGDQLHVQYEVPVFDLLWRKATFVLQEDVDIEAGNSIDLRPLDSIDPSIPRSPIRVVEAQTTDGLQVSKP